MNDYVTKANTGKLWKNKNKTKDEHPNASGESAIDKQLLMDLIAKGEDPVKIQVSAWKNKAKNGETYLSLKYSEPFVPEKKAAPAQEEDDEDVPF